MVLRRKESTNEVSTNKTRFTARDKAGKKYTWAFWRENGWWYLSDCDGYVRTLEKTWLESVPLIRLVLSNYDMTANIS